MLPQISQRFSRDMTGLKNLFALSERKDAISFAGGYPAKELFPKAALDQAFKARTSQSLADFYQYSSALGYLPLRQKLAQRAKKAGINCQADNIMLTQGAQQAISLLADLYLDEGDCMAVEAPTYIGALEAFQSRKPHFFEVEMQADGLDLDQLEAICQSYPLKLVYTIPDFQNPTGICMSLRKRQRLAQMAAEYGFLVIEDDPYRDLRYQGESLPSIKSFDQKGNVVFLGSFSKILAPALRTGWMIADPQIIGLARDLRLAYDCNPSNIIGQAIDEYLTHNDLEAHIAKINHFYQQRLQLMLTCLKQEFPAECHFTKPKGGFFIWVTLPKEYRAQDLLTSASEVTFVEGSELFVVSHQANGFRLNFTGVNEAQIKKGCRLLGQALKKMLRQQVVNI